MSLAKARSFVKGYAESGSSHALYQIGELFKAVRRDKSRRSAELF